MVWALSNFTVFVCMVATTILSWISSDLYSSKLHHIIGANKAVKNAALIVFCLLGLPLSITYSVPFSVTAELTAGTGGGQGLATGVLNLAIVVPQVRYFVLNALFQYALLLDPDASILFADSCVTGSRSMGCSVWGRKRPGVCPGFCFLPDSRRACSSEATKAIKLVQVRRFSWLWVILGAQSRLLFRNLHEHTHSAPFCHLFTLK